MKRTSEADVDLWGDPIPPPAEKRGRPVHVVTDKKRLRVAVLRSLNHSHDEIAAAMGIARNTLTRCYLNELRHGLAQKRAEVMVLLWQAVEGGNITAMKEFIRQVDKSDLKGAVVPRPARSIKLGKKEQAVLDADRPDTSSSMGDLIAKRMATESVH